MHSRTFLNHSRIYVSSSDSSCVILPLNNRSRRVVSSATKALLGERDGSISKSNSTQNPAGKLFLHHSTFSNSSSPVIARALVQVMQLVIVQTIIARISTILCPIQIGSKSCLGWGAFPSIPYAMSRKEVTRWTLLCTVAASISGALGAPSKACKILFDGRLPLSVQPADFDKNSSIYDHQFVHGESKQ